MRQVHQRLAPAPQQRIVQQVVSKPVQQTVQSASPSTLSNKQSPMKPPQQLLETEQDMPGDFSKLELEQKHQKDKKLSPRTLK